jgi:hypothetical protein
MRIALTRAAVVAAQPVQAGKVPKNLQFFKQGS